MNFRVLYPLAALAFLLITGGCGGRHLTVYQATLADPAQKTPEITTEEMQRIVDGRSALILDARPVAEWAVSHIPGAVAIAPKPGVSKALYVSDVAEVDRVVKGDKAQPLVLYCDGTFCGKSKRLADELLAAGYTDVRRYQLGIPVWRALGYPTEIEPAGIAYVLEQDRTAAFIDARDADAYAKETVAGARNIPASLVMQGKDVGEIRKAKDDGRLPVTDRNTRIIVFGDDAAQAVKVADALAREAFHNVSYYPAGFQTLKQFLAKQAP